MPLCAYEDINCYMKLAEQTKLQELGIFSDGGFLSGLPVVGGHNGIFSAHGNGLLSNLPVVGGHGGILSELYAGAHHDDGDDHMHGHHEEDHMHGADQYMQELGHCSGSACNQMRFLQDLCSGSACNKMHYLQNLTADPLSEGIHHLTDGSIINIIG